MTANRDELLLLRGARRASLQRSAVCDITVTNTTTCASPSPHRCIRPGNHHRDSGHCISLPGNPKHSHTQRIREHEDGTIMDMRSFVRRMLDPERRLELKQPGTQVEEGSVILETALSAIVLLTFPVRCDGGSLRALLLPLYLRKRRGKEPVMRSFEDHLRDRLLERPVPVTAPLACQASSTDIQNYVKNLGFPKLGKYDSDPRMVCLYFRKTLVRPHPAPATVRET